MRALLISLVLTVSPTVLLLADETNCGPHWQPLSGFIMLRAFDNFLVPGVTEQWREQLVTNLSLPVNSRAAEPFCTSGKMEVQSLEALTGISTKDQFHSGQTNDSVTLFYEETLIRGIDVAVLSALTGRQVFGECENCRINAVEQVLEVRKLRFVFGDKDAVVMDAVLANVLRPSSHVSWSLERKELVIVFPKYLTIAYKPMALKLEHHLALPGEIGVSSGAQLDLTAATPIFPWPAPTATAFVALPRKLLIGSPDDTFDQILKRIVERLHRADIYEFSVYAISSGGFAVVTNIEQIDNQGNPLAGAARWEIEPHIFPSFSLASIVTLLKGIAGQMTMKFRVFAVVVAPVAAANAQTSLPSDFLRSDHLNQLPSDLAVRKADSRYSCQVLVYEFTRINARDLSFTPRDSLQGIDHLEKAHLWTRKDLQ